MPQKQNTLSNNPSDTVAIEKAFEETCFGDPQITHRFEPRRLVTSVWYDVEINKQKTNHQNYTESLIAFTNFKANLQRRKKTSNTLMEANTAIRQLIERVQLVPENGELK